MNDLRSWMGEDEVSVHQKVWVPESSQAAPWLQPWRLRSMVEAHLPV